MKGRGTEGNVELNKINFLKKPLLNSESLAPELESQGHVGLYEIEAIIVMSTRPERTM